MTPEDAACVRGIGTVAVTNNTVFLAPWADILYSCDPQWWSTYADRIRDFKGERYCLEHKGIVAPDGVVALEWEQGEGLGRGRIRTGHNSGYQLINLAFLRGAKTIVLLGYDMQHSKGRKHWHADHPRNLGNFSAGMPELCRSKFPALAQGLQEEHVRVINCTRNSALECFERMPLERALRII